MAENTINKKNGNKKMNEFKLNPKKDNKQQTLFDIPQDWESEWVDMPKYESWEEPEPEITAKFKFRNIDDFNKFKKIVSEYCYNGNKVFDGNQSLKEKQAWFPLKEKPNKWRYVSTRQIKPKYPIYIISKGRYETNPTSKALQRMQVPFRIVVEEHEYEKYCKIVDKKDILILPSKFKKEYDTFWDNTDGVTGSGAARNFVWEHSKSHNHHKHWILDDNIHSFRRLHKNMQIKCENGFVFALAERFVDRYDNVALSGFEYDKFSFIGNGSPPYRLNTRIYSCILINNNIPFRWSGKYNEDTDLSLRLLKNGYTTILFNTFLQDKRTTQVMKGGNTDEIYNGCTKDKSQMLYEMHPDLVQLSNKFNREHHHVNYKVFKQKLIKKTIIKEEPFHEEDIKLIKVL